MINMRAQAEHQAMGKNQSELKYAMRSQLLRSECTNKAFLRRIQSVWLEPEAQEIKHK
jgi:hypothetical protein